MKIFALLGVFWSLYFYLTNIISRDPIELTWYNIVPGVFSVFLTSALSRLLLALCFSTMKNRAEYANRLNK